MGVMPVAQTVAGMPRIAMTVTLDHLQPNGPSFAQVLCVCVCVCCVCVCERERARARARACVLACLPASLPACVWQLVFAAACFSKRGLAPVFRSLLEVMHYEIL